MMIAPRRPLFRRSPLSSALLIGAALLWIVAGLSGCGSEGSANNGSGDDEEQAVPVSTAPVRAEALRETVRGVGTLQAAETVEIRPEINGTITEVHFTEGSEVEEDALLYSIDERKLERQLAAREAALASAEARLANAQRVFDRIRNLIDENLASFDEYSEAEAELDAANADVELAQAEIGLVEEQLEDARIRAPFQGMISQSEVDRGDYASEGDLLATMYRIDEMEITFQLPERYMGRVKTGQPVTVTVSAYPNQKFSGEIYFVSPAVREQTRDFMVQATVDNPREQLSPGTFATAVVTIEVIEDRPVIPEESLVATREGYLVFVIDRNGVARRREVITGLRETGRVGVIEGVEVGERVVTEGHMQLNDGTPVRVMNENGEEEDTPPADEPRGDEPLDMQTQDDESAA